MGTSANRRTRLGRRHVAHVSRVTDLVRRRAVRHPVRVEVRPRGHAAVRGVAELVDVEPVEALGEAGDVADDFRGAVARLRERHGALDAGGAGEDADRLLLVRGADDEGGGAARGCARGERLRGERRAVGSRRGRRARQPSIDRYR